MIASPSRIASCCFVVLVGLSGAASGATVDDETLNRGAELAHHKALTAAQGARRVNADAANALRVRRIGNRLVAATVATVPDTRRFTWSFNLITEPEPDVRVYPGGRVFVTDALVTKTGFNDDEIAAVIAHAIAHAALGHDISRLQEALSTHPVAADPNRQVLDVAEATAEMLRRLRYQPAEIEAADRTGLEIMARAVYDPRAATSAWRRLAVANRGIVERAPASGERLAALDASVRNAVALYEESRVKSEELARRSEENRRRAFVSGPRGPGQGPPFPDPGIPRR